MEAVEHLLAVERPAGFERHRRRIGQRGIERRLIDVDADAGHRAHEPLAREIVFDQDTHQLAVAGIDVVGPLDAGIDPVGIEGVDQRERHGLREQELLAHRQKRRAQHDRKEKIHPLGTRPRMAPLTAAGRLPLGADHVAVTVTRLACEVVGRGRLRNMIDHGS